MRQNPSRRLLKVRKRNFRLITTLLTALQAPARPLRSASRAGPCRKTLLNRLCSLQAPFVRRSRLSSSHRPSTLPPNDQLLPPRLPPPSPVLHLRISQCITLGLAQTASFLAVTRTLHAPLQLPPSPAVICPIRHHIRLRRQASWEQTLSRRQCRSRDTITTSRSLMRECCTLPWLCLLRETLGLGGTSLFPSGRDSSGFLPTDHPSNAWAAQSPSRLTRFRPMSTASTRCLGRLRRPLRRGFLCQKKKLMVLE